MGRFLKHKAIGIIGEAYVVPLFFHADPDIGRGVADALFAAGYEALEFTNRGEGALPAFRALSAHVRENYPHAMLGAGSVHDPDTAAQFLAEGADFIVGALFRAEIAKLCAQHQTLYIPGCGTATEIMTATEAGCEIVKIFPADTLGGPAFLKALRGPLPWLKAIPAGGVKATAESLKGWVDAGAFAVCMGSDLVSSDVLKTRDFKTLAAAAAKTRALMADIKRH